jgi:hypothetical protein
MFRLKARRIDEYELSFGSRQYPGDALARGLRFPRRNANFLTDEMIEQRRFANIRSTHYRRETASMCHFAHERVASS